MPIITVMVDLDNDEIASKAQDLCSKLAKIDDLKHNKKQYDSDINEQVKEIEAQMVPVRMCVELRQEEKKFDCFEDRDYEKKEIRYFDRLSNDLIKTVPMLDSDLQLSIDDEIENADETAADVNDDEAQAVLDNAQAIFDEAAREARGDDEEDDDTAEATREINF